MTDTPPRICVVGSLNVDLSVRVERFPLPGETVAGGPLEMHPGGKGANQAVAASRMGASVAMIGRVGDDEHGRRLRSALAAERVDVQHVLPTPGEPTGTAVVTVAPTGQNTIVVVAGANASLSTADVESHRDVIAQADLLLVQLESPLETVTRAAQAAHDAGVTVVLNAAPARPLTPDLLAHVDVLVVNETEAAVVTALPADDAASLNEERLVRRLADLPVGTVVLTVGERGSWAAQSGARGPMRAEPFRVRAIDAVGAGDAFVGAFAARWAQQQVTGGLDEMGLLDCLFWANAAGALAATRRGALPSLPTRGEVVALLRQAPPTAP